MELKGHAAQILGSSPRGPLSHLICVADFEGSFETVYSKFTIDAFCRLGFRIDTQTLG